jgi:hypothetical protein
MRTRKSTCPDAIKVNYNPVETLGLVLSDFLIQHDLAWSDELRKAWEEADRYYRKLDVTSDM